MNNYKKPIAIGIGICPHTGHRVEYPIWSDEVIAESKKILNEILEGAKNNGVKPSYYLKEFLIEEK